MSAPWSPAATLTHPATLARNGNPGLEEGCYPTGETKCVHLKLSLFLIIIFNLIWKKKEMTTMVHVYNYVLS